MSRVLSFWNHNCCFKNVWWAFGIISSNVFSPHQLLQILWRVFSLFHPCSSSLATGESPRLSGCQWRWASGFITETSLLCYSVAAASQAGSTFCLHRTQKCFYLKKIYMFVFQEQVEICSGHTKWYNSFCQRLQGNMFDAMSCDCRCPYLPDGYLSSIFRLGTQPKPEDIWETQR